MKDDPPVRADNRCAACSRKRTIPKKLYATREQHESDPFCSVECCRRWHGTATKTMEGRDEDLYAAAIEAA